MSAVQKKNVPSTIQSSLEAKGLRFTSQREHVYGVLLEERDHPTAEQVFFRAKRSMSDISMATVYNCLDALVRCRLVREVNVDRSARRYCPNMHEHHHFLCESCGGTYDIDLSPDMPAFDVPVPRGFQPARYEITIRGTCPRCGKKRGKRA